MGFSPSHSPFTPTILEGIPICHELKLMTAWPHHAANLNLGALEPSLVMGPWESVIFLVGS